MHIKATNISHVKMCINKTRYRQSSSQRLRIYIVPLPIICCAKYILTKKRNKKAHSLQIKILKRMKKIKGSIKKKDTTILQYFFISLAFKHDVKLEKENIHKKQKLNKKKKQKKRWY